MSRLQYSLDSRDGPDALFPTPATLQFSFLIAVPECGRFSELFSHLRTRRKHKDGPRVRCSAFVSRLAIILSLHNRKSPVLRLDPITLTGLKLTRHGQRISSFSVARIQAEVDEPPQIPFG